MFISDILQPTHLILLLAVALLVLGPKRLPDAARSLGRGLRDFKTAVNGDPQDPAPPTSLEAETGATRPARRA